MEEKYGYVSLTLDLNVARVAGLIEDKGGRWGVQPGVPSKLAALISASSCSVHVKWWRGDEEKLSSQLDSLYALRDERIRMRYDHQWQLTATDATFVDSSVTVKTFAEVSFTGKDREEIDTIYQALIAKGLLRRSALSES